MNVVPHVCCNGALGAPESQEAHVSAVPVMFASDHASGLPVVCTFWKPTSDELGLLLMGQPVMLTVVGRSMPPVRLEVYSDG